MSTSHKIRFSNRVLFILISSFVLTIALSIGVFVLLKIKDKQKTLIKFESVGKELVYVIESEISKQLQIATALKSFYQSSEEITFSEFETFTKPFFKNNLSVKALEWAPRILIDERVSFEENAQDIIPNHHFQFTELNKEGFLVGSGLKEEYYPVYYMVPFGANKLAWGYDLYSEEKRREAIDKANRTNHTVATEPLKLVQTNDKNVYSTLVFESVCVDSTIKGIVLVVYDIDALLRNVIQHFGMEGLNLDLTYGNKHIFVSKHKAHSNLKNLTFQNKITFLNQQWNLKVSPNYLYVDEYESWRPFSVSCLIFLLGMGGLIIYIQSVRSKMISEQIVKEKTKALVISGQELEQFAYIISHDLQEPLYTLKSYLGLFEEMYQENIDEQGLTFLKFSIDSSERMQSMLHELLMFSNIGHEVEHRKIDVEFLLGIVLEELNTKINREGIIINLDNLHDVYGDFIEIKKVFIYLIENSIKFRDENRNLVIDIFCENYDDDFVKISIRDNGIGIQKEHFERVFFIFQRLHVRNEYEGNGMGLSICKKIIGLHGGEISIDSIFGQETTISFTLPKP